MSKQYLTRMLAAALMFLSLSTVVPVQASNNEDQVTETSENRPALKKSWYKRPGIVAAVVGSTALTAGAAWITYSHYFAAKPVGTQPHTDAVGTQLRGLGQWLTNRTETFRGALTETLVREENNPHAFTPGLADHHNPILDTDPEVTGTIRNMGYAVRNSEAMQWIVEKVGAAIVKTESNTEISNVQLDMASFPITNWTCVEHAKKALDAIITSEKARDRNGETLYDIPAALAKEVCTFIEGCRPQE
jgi:hypothetical protein